MGDLIHWRGITKLPIDPDGVLTEAVGKLETAVVMGWTKDGGLYFASSVGDGGDVLWLMARCQHKLMEIADNDEDWA